MVIFKALLSFFCKYQQLAVNICLSVCLMGKENEHQAVTAFHQAKPITLETERHQYTHYSNYQAMANKTATKNTPISKNGIRTLIASL